MIRSLVLCAVLCALPLAARAQSPDKVGACTTRAGLKAQGDCLQGVVDEAQGRLKAAIAILQDRTSIEMRGKFAGTQQAWENYRDQSCGRMEWDIEKAGLAPVQQTAACVVRLTEQRIDIVNDLLAGPN